jgi:FkbM family methyltransferase
MGSAKHIIMTSVKLKNNGEISLEPFQNSHRKELAKSKKMQQIIFVLFEMFMSFVLRMHIAGIIKQISLMLERKFRSVASALLSNILLRNPVVSINGVKYYLSDARLESLFTLSSEYEKYVWKYFKPALGDVFVDVGANIGKYTLQVARIVGGEGLVITLEPHPGNYRALLRGIQLNGFRNIVPFNVAAWDRDCKLKLFVHEASVYHSTKLDVGLGYVEVEARTIDQVIVELSIKQVDWIKIDVEDAEIEVLRGLKKTLAKYAPRLIIEVQWKNLKGILKLTESYHYAVKSIAGEQNSKDKVGYFYCEPIPTRATRTNIKTAENSALQY